MVPRYTLPDSRFSVLLNANAGRVTPRLARAIERVVPAGRLHLTQSPDHAREILHRCVEEEISTIFAGGGDGTIVSVINALAAIRRDTVAGHSPPLPSVGVLRLGTGNALAHWLGSGRPVKDLLRWQGGLIHRTVPAQMVETEDTLFPFAGLGHDAAVLNDYEWLKQKAEGRWWQPLVKGISGYVLAAYLKTLPNYLRRANTRVRITNLGRPASLIGPDGHEVGEPIATGGVIYEGPSSIVAVATTPYYGYGLKMFPHATRRAGRFQLRVLNMNALQAGWAIVPAWRGKLCHPGLRDYYVDRIRVQFEDAMPWQLAGEAMGYRKEITFSLAEYPIDLVAQA